MINEDGSVKKLDTVRWVNRKKVHRKDEPLPNTDLDEHYHQKLLGVKLRQLDLPRREMPLIHSQHWVVTNEEGARAYAKITDSQGCQDYKLLRDLRFIGEKCGDFISFRYHVNENGFFNPQIRLTYLRSEDCRQVSDWFDFLSPKGSFLSPKDDNSSTE